MFERAAQRGAIDLPVILNALIFSLSPCNALAMHFEQRQPWEKFHAIIIFNYFHKDNFTAAEINHNSFKNTSILVNLFAIK